MPLILLLGTILASLPVARRACKDIQEEDIMNVNDKHYHFQGATVSASSLTITVEEETLVADARAGLTPAQMVDRKLASLLESTGLPTGRQPNARQADSQQAEESLAR
jgi:hypothetical protein